MPCGATHLDRFDLFGDCRFGDLLHRHVDGRKDAQATLVDALPAEPIHQLAPDLFLEVQPVRFFGPEAVAEDDLGGLCLGTLHGVDVFRLEHRLEHDVPARCRTGQTDGRRIARRRFHETGEERRFWDVEL